MFLLVIIFFIFQVFATVRADELADIEQQLNEVRSLLEASKKTSVPLEANLRTIESKMSAAEAQINALAVEVENKKEEITLGEKDLIKQRQIINERARNYYKQSRGYMGNILGLFLSKNIPLATRSYLYQQQSLQNDKDTIIKTAFFIRSLEDKKDQLVDEQQQLAVFKKELDQEKTYFQAELAKVKGYEAELSSKIVELTARQQALIASRISGLNISRSAGTVTGCVDDRGLDPGFGTAFAFYTYGIPHRVGLNQYGAKGRADSGQSYEEILRAYFNFDALERYDPNTPIKVEGNGEFSLEEYTLRIYEVPESWPIEALKAQAVAARSYALRYIQDKRDSGQLDEICTTQSCQVFQSNPKTGQWAQAVKDTEGMVLVQGGKPIKAWFASTFGGYTHTSAEVWGGETAWTKNASDVSSGVGSFSDLQNNSWDKESKCFYNAQGSRSEYGNSAWLRPSEVADIVNTLLLVKKDSGASSHLYQTDKSNPEGTDNWDSEKVKSLISNPFHNVTDVRITGVDFSGGNTTEIVIVEGGHEERFNGSEFRDRFNLRAPGNISIVGPLYSIEKR
jgi:SpoIID/LytB domain protein